MKKWEKVPTFRPKTLHQRPSMIGASHMSSEGYPHFAHNLSPDSSIVVLSSVIRRLKILHIWSLSPLEFKYLIPRASHWSVGLSFFPPEKKFCGGSWLYCRARSSSQSNLMHKPDLTIGTKFDTSQFAHLLETTTHRRIFIQWYGRIICPCEYVLGSNTLKYRHFQLEKKVTNYPQCVRSEVISFFLAK